MPIKYIKVPVKIIFTCWKDFTRDLTVTPYTHSTMPALILWKVACLFNRIIYWTQIYNTIINTRSFFSKSGMKADLTCLKVYKLTSLSDGRLWGAADSWRSSQESKYRMSQTSAPPSPSLQRVFVAADKIPFANRPHVLCVQDSSASS